jgi:hypothetical protein
VFLDVGGMEGGTFAEIYKCIQKCVCMGLYVCMDEWVNVM